MLAAAETTSGGGLGWRDVLTALVGLATLWVGYTTARTSRRTNKDNIESQAYTRADAITDKQFERLEKEVDRLTKNSETKDAQIAELGSRVEKAELRADKAEKRVDHLLDYLRQNDYNPPPGLPD